MHTYETDRGFVVLVLADRQTDRQTDRQVFFFPTLHIPGKTRNGQAPFGPSSSWEMGL